MIESRTIFLATDGWHLIIEPRRNGGLIREALNAVEARGMRGWLAVLRGNIDDSRLPQVMRVHTVGKVTTAEWKTAVEALQHGSILQA